MHLIAFLNNIYFNISVYQICMAQTYTFKIKPCVLVVQTHTFKPNPHTGGTPATIELKNKSLLVIQTTAIQFNPHVGGINRHFST